MRRKARKGGGRQATLAIKAIGARGDGYAELDGRPVFVPLTLPGDEVLVRITGETSAGLRGEVIELTSSGPGRREPPCTHFGPCGGCALQHLDDATYRAWKEQLLPKALSQRGLETEVQPVTWIDPATRRRVVLAAKGQGRSLKLGFHLRHSHDVIDLEACPIMTPALFAALAPLRAALQSVPSGKRGLTVTLIETESGLDLLLEGEKALDLAAREALAAFAEAQDIARISWRETGEAVEPVAERRPPKLTFGGVEVVPPPGGFLQPSAEGEAALRDLVLTALPESPGRILELFSGCGSFTFPLLNRGAVFAVDGDPAALGALQAAARLPSLQGRLETAERDLFRRPYGTDELKDFDTVVFDPPRAGAQAQAARLAESPVPTVVAVSCNPATFARDARILVDGGYRLAWAAPVDQFVWSPHLELVAIFERAA